MSVLLMFIGVAICTAIAYDAVRYWQDLPYVLGRNYAMMAYYVAWFLYGLFFVAC